MATRPLCIAIIGPTASGKSAFAFQLAQKLGGEIVCVDSTTVYKGFDVGTSKPSAAEQAAIAHHCLDLLNPEAEFNAFDFVASARNAIEAIGSRGKVPILVGGSYFYLRALQNGMYPTGGYDDALLDSITEEFTTEDLLDTAKMHETLAKADPDAAQSIHQNDEYRLVRAVAMVRSGKKPSTLKPSEGLDAKWVWIKYAMAVSRKRLATNIALRTSHMLKAGLVDEVRSLMDKHAGAKPLESIGYKEASRFLRGDLPEGKLEQEINENTRRLVKRQMTWLRSDPEVRFIDSGDLPRVELEISNLRSALGE